MIYQILVFALHCYYVCGFDVNYRYYPRYHLAPPQGWMNDPNGFCVFKNEYHLFYQFNPNSSMEAGLRYWGHAKSKDLFHWQNLPIAMSPDQWYDEGGVFSGSAIVENDTMFLFYTGNVYFPGDTSDYREYQVLGISTDGVNVEKPEYNPILNHEALQPDIRDPKVWKHENTYYMVLGNSYRNSTVGRVLLYSSYDKISWEEISILAESDGSLGYMWECPDFFELNGHFILLFSPQGIEPQGDRYKNLFQTGYIVGDFDYESLIFTPLTEFRELDHGHDIYATQTIEDEEGRRIVIAWLDMWETHYPEAADGFTGQMTIPRVLTLTDDNFLLQKPVREIKLARDRMLHSSKATNGTTVILEDNTGEIFIEAPSDKDFMLSLESDDESSIVTFFYDHNNGTVTLNRGGSDGERRTKWRPRGIFLLEAYVDASSLEIFLGNGEVTFSSRFFPEGAVQLQLAPDSHAYQLTVHKMKRTYVK